MKPKGYTVYDLEPVLDWMVDTYEWTEKRADKFREDVIAYLPIDSTGQMFLATEDCKNVPGLCDILREFGECTWTNRGGVDQYEIHLLV